MATANYTRDEERQVAEQIRLGLPPECPRCGGALARREVRPRAEVAYVRDRIWLMCGRCRRSMVLERPPGRDPESGPPEGTSGGPTQGPNGDRAEGPESGPS